MLVIICFKVVFIVCLCFGKLSGVIVWMYWRVMLIFLLVFFGYGCFIMVYMLLIC